MLILITQTILIVVVVEVVVTVRRHVHVVDVEDAQGRVERLLRARVQTGCRKQTGHDQATVPGLIPNSILVKYELRPTKIIFSPTAIYEETSRVTRRCPGCL